MPSYTQIKELLNNTENILTTLNGVNGRLFTSKKDSSKSIFIPAAGKAWYGVVEDTDNYGYIWSSTKSNYYIDCGWHLWFDSDIILQSCVNRCFGLSVRGVIG